MTSPSIHQLRRSELERLIEEAIALLDEIDGDCDLEDGGDAEPSIGSPALHSAKGMEYDLEYDTADCELNLGWSEYQSIHGCVPTGDEFGPTYGSLQFNGDGHHIGRKLLRDKVKDQRKLAKALDATRVSPGYGRYVP